jgi:hypothetical protein
MPPKYDSENDVLFLTFSDKSNSYGDELDEYITLMRDWDSNEITGAIVYEFSKRLLPEHVPMAYAVEPAIK